MIAMILGRFDPVEKRSMPTMLVFGLIMLAVRILLATPFWKSGLTRWDDFPSGYLTKLSFSTKYLFVNEFKLHFFWGEMAIPFPEIVGYLTAVAEIALPVVIIIGLLTRFGGLALLGMAVVIQLVYPEALFNTVDPMNSHALWMAYAVVIVIFGPGMFSLDYVLRKMGIGRSSAAAPA